MMDLIKEFNGEEADVFEQYINNNLVVSPNDCFKSTEAVCEAISFIRCKRICSKFQICVELFHDPILVTDGDINELDHEFVKFYCETEPNVKVAWVEADNTGMLQIMMTTV